MLGRRSEAPISRVPTTDSRQWMNHCSGPRRSCALACHRSGNGGARQSFCWESRDGGSDPNSPAQTPKPRAKQVRRNSRVSGWRSAAMVEQAKRRDSKPADHTLRWHALSEGRHRPQPGRCSTPRVRDLASRAARMPSAAIWVAAGACDWLPSDRPISWNSTPPPQSAAKRASSCREPRLHQSLINPKPFRASHLPRALRQHSLWPLPTPDDSTVI